MKLETSGVVDVRHGVVEGENVFEDTVASSSVTSAWIEVSGMG